MTPARTYRKPSAITPYWECFPQFFAYPFRLEALLPLAGFAFVFVALTWFTGDGLPGALAMLLIAVFFLRFAFSVLERTALGHIGETPLAFEHDDAHKWRPYKHFVALVLAGALVGLTAAMLGPLAAELLSLVLMLVWPASIMQLALSDSLIESVSPNLLWSLIRDIGLPYLGLWACLSMLGIGISAAIHYLPVWFDNGLLVALGIGFVYMYFTLVMYRLMGYVLYQYHDAIGLAVHGMETAPATPQQQAIDEAGALLGSGDTDAALATLRAALRAHPGELNLHDRNLKLLIAANAPDEPLRDAAARYLDALQQAGKRGQALNVVESVRRRLPEFQPGNGQLAVQLAQLAYEQRKPALAISLLRGFEKRYPGNADIATAMLLGARLLCEHRNDDTQASKLLQALIARFPQHPARAEAERLLLTITRLATQ
ncbi:tetratricopeptide repeat protein [Jeongeupia naejangsanensis]|uniref:Tetratricopeptide repeat protein n=1 Tax=Jeongeupia naejangsanensis TaxID=613195 RepID=A0ABS2BGT9_9NEIS|nr:tetratricopeptide repeat protein [Jeongeupia naejangsanensis]MBM3114822.1 tetratricopeptide repeat protein [Jeongeupia naejangsanensis]